MGRKIFGRLLVVFGLVCFYNSSALAQTQVTHGRDGQGRAYRIDRSGFKLMDELAEQEVRLDEQKQQIANLENEIEEKDLLIKKLKAGNCASAIKEHDIPIKTPVTSSAQSEQTDCTPLISPLETKISLLQKQLQESEQERQSLVSENGQLAGRTQSAMQRVEAEKSNGQEQLTRRSQEYQTELGGKDREIESLEGRLNKAQDTIADKSAKAEELQHTIELLNEQIASLSASVSLYQKQAAAQQRAEQKSQSIAEANRAVQQALSPTNANTMYARQELSQSINGIQRLIGERKSLYDRVKESRTNISISLQVLTTSDGESLDELRAQVLRVQDDESAQRLLRKLSEIEAVLRDDIKLLRRMSKI